MLCGLCLIAKIFLAGINADAVELEDQTDILLGRGSEKLKASEKRGFIRSCIASLFD